MTLIDETYQAKIQNEMRKLAFSGWFLATGMVEENLDMDKLRQ